MSYIVLGVLGLSAIAVLVGFFLGFFRGFRRSVLRSILLILCIVGAFFLKNVVLNAIKTVKLDGKTINDYITELLTGQEILSKIKDQVLPAVESLVSIIVYVAILLLLQFISLVVIYPICKIFVRKPSFGHKKRLLGGVVSLVTSLVMCVAVIGPISGLLGNVSEIVTVANEASVVFESKGGSSAENTFSSFATETGSSETQNDATSKAVDKTFDMLKKIGLIDYNNSIAGKIYGTTSGWYYKMVSKVEYNGRKICFDTQVGAITGAIKLVSQVIEVSEIDFQAIFSGEGTTEYLINSMKKIDEIKNNMSPEEKEELNKIVKETFSTLMDSVDSSIDFGIDLSETDITDISFEKEAKVFADLSMLSEKNEGTLEDEKIKELIKDLSETTIILSVVDSTIGEDKNLAKDIPSEQLEVIKNTINSDVQDADAQARLRKLFGIVA